MRTEEVGWYSDGDHISALWRTPDGGAGPYRAIVQGPGWLGLKDAKLYVRYHEALTAAGFAVLVFDYRGFGDSAGDRGVLSPARQLQDLRSAVTYLEARPDVQPDGIGAFGSGGTGGGNAVLLAAADPRIRAAVSQLPVADGADWLHRMRSEYAWLEFLESVRADRRDRVLTGGGRAVHPREEIMVPTRERRATKVKSDVDGRIPTRVEFAPAVEEILAYRPVDAAAALATPLLVVGIEGDATTPTDHAERIYAAAAGPKELVMQRHTTHYAAYDRYWEAVTPRIVDWFDRHLGPADVVLTTPAGPHRLEVPDAGDLRIHGGRVITPAGALDADVLVRAGRITGLVDAAADAPAERTLDASGRLVLPGMVDVHVHTREPGFTHKEDIRTTTAQAAAGGVTTIFGMPNLDPPTTTDAALADVLDRYAASSVVDYNHNPAATLPDQIAPMAARGVRAFKVYMVVDTGRTYPHPAGTGMHDHGDLLRMMDTIAGTGARFIVHPHDQALMDYIEGRYLERGENTPQAYARAYAERQGVIWDTAIDVVLRLAEASGCPVHLAHMQTRRSIAAVRRAKAAGVDVTCEVNHWALFLATWEDVERLGPYALSYWVPDDARAAVWEGVRDGTIDVCSSDHAPHTREEKEIGWTEMWSAHTGTPGIQYYYPLLLDAAARGELPLTRVAELVAGAPARRFGLAGRKGALLPGHDADIVVAHPDSPWTITDEGVLSRCGWTPYAGRGCRMKIERTFVRGTEVYADGSVVGAPGHGRLA